MLFYIYAPCILDINECLEFRDKPACGLNGLCKNVPGTWKCECPPGYVGNAYVECTGT